MRLAKPKTVLKPIKIEEFCCLPKQIKVTQIKSSTVEITMRTIPVKIEHSFLLQYAMVAKFAILDLFFTVNINITPTTKFKKPIIVLEAMNVEAVPRLPRQLKVTQLAMKVFVGMFLSIFNMNIIMVAIIIRTIPMEKESICLLECTVIGRAIMKTLFNPRVKTAMGLRLEITFCKAESQNNKGVA
ncbi:hypothetical protein FO519_003029 [Halicephalobus sp. NKZ332]|nr:hypothetical protein FO519_003029 [Halicephalobus sp. NKZ332]